MFGIEIWPHEFYYVAGLLIMAALFLIGWFPEIVTYLPQTMSRG